MKDIKTEFEQIMQKFDEVVTLMESMHTPSLSFGTGVLMYRREIHTIQSIGRNPGINVTNLAEYMGVTKGAVSQIIKKLIKKGLVRRTHTPGNAKEVVLELTELGWTGFHNHEKFHMDSLGIAREYFGDKLQSKLQMIYTVMNDISIILKEYENRTKHV
jgi:DNA-binding MarR family transcriptional regulator